MHRCKRRLLPSHAGVCETQNRAAIYKVANHDAARPGRHHSYVPRVAARATGRVQRAYSVPRRSRHQARQPQRREATQRIDPGVEKRNEAGKGCAPVEVRPQNDSRHCVIPDAHVTEPNRWPAGRPADGARKVAGSLARRLMATLRRHRRRPLPTVPTAPRASARSRSGHRAFLARCETGWAALVWWTKRLRRFSESHAVVSRLDATAGGRAAGRRRRITVAEMVVRSDTGTRRAYCVVRCAPKLVGGVKRGAAGHVAYQAPGLPALSFAPNHVTRAKESV